MHPRQASVLSQANEIAERTAVETKTAAAPVMWKYTDGSKTFYLDEKVMPCKSPWTGKSLKGAPVRTQFSAMVQDLKGGDEGGEGGKEAGEKNWK